MKRTVFAVFVLLIASNVQAQTVAATKYSLAGDEDLSHCCMKTDGVVNYNYNNDIWSRGYAEFDVSSFAAGTPVWASFNFERGFFDLARHCRAPTPSAR